MHLCDPASIKLQPMTSRSVVEGGNDRRIQIHKEYVSFKGPGIHFLVITQNKTEIQLI